MKAILLLALACVPAVAQHADDLHQKYRRPVAETYLVRPNVFVTATFAQNGEVCVMVITPQLLSTSMDHPSTEIMKSKDLTGVIDELVPESKRGKPIISGFFNAACPPLNNCGGTTASYEHLSIFRNGGMDKERYAIIRWTRTACQK